MIKPFKRHFGTCEALAALYKDVKVLIVPLAIEYSLCHSMFALSQYRAYHVQVSRGVGRDRYNK